ncbi:MAG: transglutaminase family protein [Chloroflexota bacterium]|nr:transglutaminase family protein [Chloroflexota bacterium]
MIEYLQPTQTIECDHEEIREFARRHADNSATPREQAISLFYAVRDSIRYDPYSFELSMENLRASTTLRTGRGFCIPKAILFTACCRSVGIPARIGFADVRNHISTARMREQLKTDVFFWHAYTSIYLNGVWVKATATFNIELCHKFRIKPLDFNGHEDALFHPFDLTGNQHMEYILYRGEFADVPLNQIIETHLEHGLALSLNNANFDLDVEQETSSD